MSHLSQHYGVTWTLDYTVTSFKPARWKVHVSSLRRKPLKDLRGDQGLHSSKNSTQNFVGYPFDYHVTLGFGSIVGGLDPVSPIIRLPIERGINSGTRIGAMAGVDINTLTMEQYLALSRENQAPDVVKPEIGGNDAILLRVISFTLTGTAKRWVDRLTPGAINTWDLLKKAFIQRSPTTTASLTYSKDTTTTLDFSSIGTNLTIQTLLTTTINLDLTELLFSTPPTSPQTLFDTPEDLPPTKTNPQPPRPLFDSIERLANEPPPILAMEPLLPPITNMEPSLQTLPPRLPTFPKNP
ncbi:hypothetical protein Tco_0766182 [Tanacetum coccineum]